MPLAVKQVLWDVMPHRVAVDKTIDMADMTAWLNDPETPCLGVYAARAITPSKDPADWKPTTHYEVRFSNATTAVFFKLRFG